MYICMHVLYAYLCIVLSPEEDGAFVFMPHDIGEKFK